MSVGESESDKAKGIGDVAGSYVAVEGMGAAKMLR